MYECAMLGASRLGSELIWAQISFGAVEAKILGGASNL